MPCGEPHSAEVYAVYDLVGGPYPGDAETEELAAFGCYTRFEDFVGLAYEDSSLDISWIWPTKDGWNQGNDRSVTCAVFPVDGEALTGSVAGLSL